MKKAIKTIKEEDAANVVGNGKVAGLGVGPQGEPPARGKSKAFKMIRRIFKVK